MILVLFDFRSQLYQEMLVVHWRFVGELQNLQIIALRSLHFLAQMLQA